ARPLREDGVFRDDLDRGNVVDTGVAENMLDRLALRHAARALADDDAELALVHHLSAVGFRPADRLAVREERIVAFEEIQGLGRHRVIELREELMIVVDERDDLARHARREELRAGEGDRLGGRLRTREHAARVHADVVAFELSEVFPSLIGDAHPLCHKTSFQRGVYPPYQALRAPPENARSYPLIPRPARRTIANPNLFRPPPGVRAFRAPGKRRRHDRAGGGYSQRRGRN